MEEEFKRIIYFDGKLRKHCHGNLTLFPNKIVWIPLRESLEKHEITPVEMESSEWIFTTRGYCLRVFLKSTEKAKEYFGFDKAKFADVKKIFTESYNVKIDRLKPSVAGRNWGEIDIRPQSFNVLNSYEEMVTINMDRIMNAAINTKKTELSLKIHTKDMTDNAQLSEMIFYVPPNKESDDQRPSIEELKEEIIKHAAVRKVGDVIMEMKDLPMVLPRGKYNLVCYRNSLKLLGSKSYTLLYEHINTMYLLKNPDEFHMYFIIMLNRPIRSGSKMLGYLVFNVPLNAQVNEEEGVKLNLEEDDYETSEAKRNHIKPVMKGVVYEILGKVLRYLTQQKLIGASNDFVSSIGLHGISCQLNNNKGFLFCLKKSMIFMTKPAHHYLHEDILYIEVKYPNNYSLAMKNTKLKLTVHLRNSNTTYTYANIDTVEQSKLKEYFDSHNIRAEGFQSYTSRVQKLDLADDEDSEEDEDFSMTAAEIEEVEEEEDEDFQEFQEEIVDRKRSRSPEKTDENEELEPPSKKVKVA